VSYEPDRWVYVNGEFIDRVANSVEQIERGFPGKVDRVEQGRSPWGPGTVDKVYLVTEQAPRCPHGFDHKARRWACPDCEKRCRFLCLVCGNPLHSEFERDGHEAVTGHGRFEDRGVLCQTLS